MPTMTCPFCSESTYIVQAPSDKRIVCRRCGESFTPVATSSESVNSLENSAETINPARAFLVPALMSGTLFVVVFTVGIYAIFFGKSNRMERSNPETAQASIPWEYLPKEINMLVDVAPGASGKNVESILKTIGLPTDAVTGMLKKMSLKDEDVSQLTLALVVANDTLLPRAVVVVQFKTPPTSPEKILEGLGAKRDGEHYKTTIGQFPVLVNRPRASVYIFATEVKDLKPQPLSMAEQTRWDSHLARLQTRPVALLIADTDDWSKKPSLELLMTMNPKNAPVLRERASQIRTVVMALTDNDTWEIQLQATNPATADKLTEPLAPASRDGKWWKLTRPANAQSGIGALSSK